MITSKLYKPFFAATWKTFGQIRMSIRSKSKIVAVCQMTSGEDKLENLNMCENLIKSAISQNASMVFLPEACDYLCVNPTDSVKKSEPENGTLIAKYKALARQYDIWLSLGGIHTKFSDEKTSNAHLIIDNLGQIVGKYHKIHMFDVELSDRTISESSYVERGKAIIPPVKSPVGSIGLAVCYDIRFPELGIALTEMGADILTYPSAFMFETGSMHWESLLRARAIENQCYVIAAAQTGYSSGRRHWGHAMIVDPLGIIRAQCSEGSQVAVTAINLELVQEMRSNMPLLKQKRYDLYPQIAAPISNSIEVSSYQFGQVVISSKTVFFKTDFTLAFVNKKCVVPGHVLVTPIRVVERLSGLSSIEISDIFQTVQKVQRVMEKVHNTKSSTIVIQDGPDAGQTISHIHVHILPRKPNDFPDNDDIYRVLEKHDKNVDVWRKEEEMIEEAEKLRAFFP